MLSSSFIRRRWLDFRNGHGLYLIFAMAFLQFVILTYTLALERVSLLKEVFPNMWVYGSVFTACYIPAATLIGHWHRKHQMGVEAIQNTNANPYLYQAQPGKERLYSLRINKIQYELQLRQMAMQNSMAASLEQITGNKIPKWREEDFDIIREFQYISERLETGANVVDIYKDLDTPHARAKLKELNLMYTDKIEQTQKL